MSEKEAKPSAASDVDMIRAAGDISLKKIVQLTDTFEVPGSVIVPQDDGSLKRVEVFREGRIAIQDINKDGRITEDVRISHRPGSYLDTEA